MIVVIDNRDSFTFNLVQELQALLQSGGRAASDVRVVRGRDGAVSDVLREDTAGVLIGPGPGEPADSGCSEDVIRARVSAAQGPVILGVCLGHQALATALGGGMRRATELVHGATRPLEHDASGLLQGLPNPLELARYNSLVVDEASLPDALRVTGRTPEGDIAALQHRDLPLFGVQGHPESILCVEEGRQLLAHFVELCSAASRAG